MKRECGFIDTQAYTGVISIIDKKFAFIQCAKARSQYGSDVFCPPQASNDRSVGDTVSFDLRLNAKSLSSEISISIRICNHMRA